jgi:hypothetical protein
VRTLRAGQQDNRFRLQARTEIYFLVQHCTGSAMLLNREAAALSSWVAQSRSEADHFLLFSTQAKNVRSYTSIRMPKVHSGCQEGNWPRKWKKGSDQIYVPTALTLKRENLVNKGSSVDVATAEKGQIPHLRRPETRLTHILIIVVTMSVYSSYYSWNVTSK